MSNEIKIISFSAPPPDSDQGDNQVPLLLESLPSELLVRILAFLSPKDMKSTVLVSRHISRLTIVAARFRINSILDVIPPEPKSLCVIKSSVLDRIERILNLLKGPKREPLNGLEKLAEANSATHCFGNIFQLVRIYKRLEKIKAMPDEGLNFNVIRKISKDLMNLGDINGAVEIAQATSIAINRSRIFSDISETLTNLDDIYWAIEGLKAISENSIFQARFESIIFEPLQGFIEVM